MSSTTTSNQSQSIHGVCTAESVMFELWERTAPSLTTEELRWFARATDQAQNILTAMTPVVESIGGLVSHDGNTQGVRAGNFQGADDVPGLLFNITHQLQTIAGLIHVGDSAAQRLYLPEAYAHEKKGGR